MANILRKQKTHNTDTHKCDQMCVCVLCTQYCEARLNSTVARKPDENLLNQGTCASVDGSGSRDMEPWLDGTLGLAKSAPKWHAPPLADAAQ